MAGGSWLAPPGPERVPPGSLSAPAGDRDLRTPRSGPSRLSGRDRPVGQANRQPRSALAGRHVRP